MNIIEQKGRTGIVMIGRDKTGKRTIKIDNSFKPYFYDDKKNKIFVDSPSDVPEMRKNFPCSYEGDIPYIKRYLIDRHPIPFPDEPLRINYYDIETNMSLDTILTPEPVVCQTSYDSFTKKYYTFVWRDDLKQKKDIRDNGKWIVFYFDNEVDFFEKWLSLIKKTQPDVFAGWNINYDIGYIINRMKKIRVNAHKLSPMDYAFHGEKGYFKKQVTEIKGRAICDLMYYYKKTKRNQTKGNTLEFFAKDELGIQKKEPKVMWADIEELIWCNKQHVELCVLGDAKMHWIERFNSLRKVAGTTWDGVKNTNEIADVLKLRFKNDLLPTKTKHDKEDFIGAFVAEVLAGVHKWVTWLDMKQLYPSIELEHNISYDTIIKGMKGPINGHMYRTDIIGTIPKVMKYLFPLRAGYKTERDKYPKNTPEYNVYHELQFSTKGIINAFYGDLGFIGSRTLDYEVAADVCWFGQKVIKYVRKLIKEKGYDLVYSDTDSVAVSMDNAKDIDDVIEKSKELVRYINSNFDKFVQKFGKEKNEYYSLEFEKIYDKIYFSNAKKRYVGNMVYADYKKITPFMDIVGFEAIRSDFNIFGSNVQRKVFEMILNDCGKAEVKRFIEKQKLGMMVANINDIAFPKCIHKELHKYEKKIPCVEGAKWANRNLYKGSDVIVGGDHIMWLYGKMPGEEYTKVITYKGKPPEGISVNWDKMIEVTINKKMAKIYKALDWVDKSHEIGEYM